LEILCLIPKKMNKIKIEMKKFMNCENILSIIFCYLKCIMFKCCCYNTDSSLKNLFLPFCPFNKFDDLFWQLSLAASLSWSWSCTGVEWRRRCRAGARGPLGCRGPSSPTKPPPPAARRSSSASRAKPSVTSGWLG